MRILSFICVLISILPAQWLWEWLDTTPVTAGDGGALAAAGNTIYAFTGEGDPDNTCHFYAYSTTANSWYGGLHDSGTTILSKLQ